MDNAKKEKKPGILDFSAWTKPQRRTLFWYTILLLAAMVAVALGVFFAVLQGAEKVMIPDVRGMDLADALVKLQERELYPRLALRFTDNPQDRNMVLEQSPNPGNIVKAGRRIRLTVSKGSVLDRIEDYVGQDIESVKLHLQALFAASHPLVTIREPPVYVFDESPAGRIIGQKPVPGTEISGPTVLEVIVSKGPEKKKAKVPSFVGLGLGAAVEAAEAGPFVVDFSMRQPKANEKAGTVVEQKPAAEEDSPVSDRVKVVLAAPAPEQGIVSGIYMYTMTDYPYPVPVRLEALRPDGRRSLVAELNHPGGSFSMPFSLPAGTTLIFSVLDKETARSEVRPQ